MDKDKTGLINAEELRDAIKTVGIKLGDSGHLNDIFAQTDYKGSQGKIYYSEFLAATVKTQDLITDEKLWYLFNQFDTKNTGFITEDDLGRAFKRIGARNISESEIKDIIAINDLDGNGVLSFDEFKMLFASEEEKDKEISKHKYKKLTSIEDPEKHA